jgi:hypothetical protein
MQWHVYSNRLATYHHKNNLGYILCPSANSGDQKGRECKAPLLQPSARGSPSPLAGEGWGRGGVSLESCLRLSKHLAKATLLVGSRPDGRDTFFCVLKRKYPKKRAPCFRGAARFPALLIKPGVSQNSPWRCQGSNSCEPTSPVLTALLGAAEGTEKRVVRCARVFCLAPSPQPLSHSGRGACPPLRGREDYIAFSQEQRSVMLRHLSRL